MFAAQVDLLCGGTRGLLCTAPFYGHVLSEGLGGFVLHFLFILRLLLLILSRGSGTLVSHGQRSDQVLAP